MLERELVIDLETGRRRPVTAHPPLRTSAPCKWEGVLIEHHRLRELDSRNITCLNHVVLLQLAGDAELELDGDLPKKKVVFKPGQVTVLPAAFPFSARSRDAGEFLSVSLEPAFLACATAEYGSLENLQLRSAIAEDDQLLAAILATFKKELESGKADGTLYAQSLATMLAVHLVEKYSISPSNRREIKGGLAKEQLLRTTTFIHERFASPITLAELADLNKVSLFHFTRLFKRSTGLTPYEYVTRVRVEKARDMLLRSQVNLTEVALQSGFYDQSHFSRHFKRVYGTTPAAFARSKKNRKIVL